MLKKAILVFVPVAAIFALCLFLGRMGGGFFGGPRITTATILRQVQTLSQLVTVKYVLERIVDVKDSKWYGENRVLLIAHGVVKAGINVDRIQPADIQISEKKITLTLPEAAITDVYLDDHQTQILERSTGIMRSFDKDLEQTARRQAVNELGSAARSAGILKDAEDRAKAQLTNLFHQAGFTEVEFKTH